MLPTAAADMLQMYSFPLTNFCGSSLAYSSTGDVLTREGSTLAFNLENQGKNYSRRKASVLSFHGKCSHSTNSDSTHCVLAVGLGVEETRRTNT